MSDEFECGSCGSTSIYVYLGRLDYASEEEFHAAIWRYQAGGYHVWTDERRSRDTPPLYREAE